ncbi:MAG: putative cytosolic protein, partial [Parcubacteria group bacterium GW2011_GWE2_40_8]
MIIFFARPDIISALFTLANFDQSEPNSTITPFGAGCSSIIHYPYLEIANKRQRAVIGMFDISARPYVEENLLTFAVPFKKFKEMV